jgi:hypothetical protein
MPVPSALWLDRFILRIGQLLPVTIQEATDIAMQVYRGDVDLNPESAAEAFAAQFPARAAGNP